MRGDRKNRRIGGECTGDWFAEYSSSSAIDPMAPKSVDVREARFGSRAAMAPGANQTVVSPLSLRALSCRLQFLSLYCFLTLGLRLRLWASRNRFSLAFGGAYGAQGVYAPTPFAYEPVWPSQANVGTAGSVGQHVAMPAIGYWNGWAEFLHPTGDGDGTGSIPSHFYCRFLRGRTSNDTPKIARDNIAHNDLLTGLRLQWKHRFDEHR